MWLPSSGDVPHLIFHADREQKKTVNDSANDSANVTWSIIRFWEKAHRRALAERWWISTISALVLQTHSGWIPWQAGRHLQCGPPQGNESLDHWGGLGIPSIQHEEKCSSDGRSGPFLSSVGNKLSAADLCQSCANLAFETVKLESTLFSLYRTRNSSPSSTDSLAASPRNVGAVALCK